MGWLYSSRAISKSTLSLTSINLSQFIQPNFVTSNSYAFGKPTLVPAEAESAQHLYFIVKRVSDTNSLNPLANR